MYEAINSLSKNQFYLLGVEVVIFKEGHSRTPKNGQKVTLHYTLTLINGRKVDSSRDRGKPFEYVVGSGNVISGFDEGIKRVWLGSRVRMTISPVSNLFHISYC